MKLHPIITMAVLLALKVSAAQPDLLTIDNGIARVGIDRAMGATITWLSSHDYPENMVNLHDPGRLIQQSYYAGKPLDRRSEGQGEAWSPWTWNPIQGGGLSSWSRVTTFEKTDANTLVSQTIPKLWDMQNEEAAAIMDQRTFFEESMPNVISVICEFRSMRAPEDAWGPPVGRHQEVPACYFTRNFSTVKSYLGNGKWREESQPPGPPWGRAQPPLQAMALFNPEGNGVALFSPAGTVHWNFGPVSQKITSDPYAPPCMHVAPIALAKLGPKSVYKFQYWMILGNEAQIAERLDTLIEKYGTHRATLID